MYISITVEQCIINWSNPLYGLTFFVSVRMKNSFISTNVCVFLTSSYTIGKKLQKERNGGRTGGGQGKVNWIIDTSFLAALAYCCANGRLIGLVFNEDTRWISQQCDVWSGIRLFDTPWGKPQKDQQFLTSVQKV